jgi:hypothetical protein
MPDAHCRDFTVTRFGVPAPRGATLNDVMELDAVVRVLPGRTVTEPDHGNRANWAPDAVVELDSGGQIVSSGEEDMEAAVRDEGWCLMYGYSGQVGGRASVIMHPSEFIGGRMAADILAVPGVYVALEVDGVYPSEAAEEADSDDPIGWVVAYRPEPDYSSLTCTACGGPLERSAQYPDAGLLHGNDADDTHAPAV